MHKSRGRIIKRRNNTYLPNKRFLPINSSTNNCRLGNEYNNHGKYRNDGQYEFSTCA